MVRNSAQKVIQLSKVPNPWEPPAPFSGAGKCARTLGAVIGHHSRDLLTYGWKPWFFFGCFSWASLLMVKLSFNFKYKEKCSQARSRNLLLQLGLINNLSWGIGHVDSSCTCFRHSPLWVCLHQGLLKRSGSAKAGFGHCWIPWAKTKVSVYT